MKYRYAPTLAILLGAAPLAFAEDVVLLTSGNRMTGTIRELSRGELQFSIDGVGRVDIDWRNVAELRSPEQFYIELTSGERETGTLEMEAGQLSITTGAGTRHVEMSDVIRIGLASERPFAEGLHGFIDGGFDFLSANDEIDWTIDAGLERRTKRHLTEVALSSLLRRRDDSTDQRRTHFEIGSRRFLEDRHFILGQVQWEEDRELDLDSRVLLGVALGRTLHQSNRSIFALYGGIDGDREHFRGFETDTVFEVHGAVEWEWFDAGSENGIQFRTIAYYAPDLSRVRIEAQAALRRDIANDFHWALRLYESYNSDPPDTLEDSDLGIGLTIGRSF